MAYITAGNPVWDDIDAEAASGYNEGARFGRDIPLFVICTSAFEGPAVYTRVEIWRTIQAALNDFAEYNPRRLAWGPGWPRRLSINRDQRLRSRSLLLGPALYEYPMPPSPNADEEDPDLDAVIDYLVIDRDGTYYGVTRYHRGESSGWSTSRTYSAFRAVHFYRDEDGILREWETDEDLLNGEPTSFEMDELPISIGSPISPVLSVRTLFSNSESANLDRAWDPEANLEPDGQRETEHSEQSQAGEEGREGANAGGGDWDSGSVWNSGGIWNVTYSETWGDGGDSW
ncbi:hypothetical protein GGS23DRAFT_554291 [Durotheca rogersii]|uniref:uncharacterized protein n=1 Tax=Durotheca rogersii TaxID=419775 RepID=UPI002220F09B|nr:uncharacterized protein GGS23DRAFT_554291 [Durotheca rogersii]KAI5865839.1 hypothetical protein GGS23DRAFT_554291 [Durotheca rogersii]